MRQLAQKWRVSQNPGFCETGRDKRLVYTLLVEFILCPYTEIR